MRGGFVPSKKNERGATKVAFGRGWRGFSKRAVALFGFCVKLRGGEAVVKGIDGVARME